MLRGNIDLVKPEGIVEGWCWDEQAPTDKIEVSILVDGVVAGCGLAGLYREDLRQAKVGDGFHKFAIVLQDYSPNKRTQTFTLIETLTRTIIGEPLLVHTKHVLSFDDRLLELENKNRLLETRLNEIIQYTKSDESMAELFSTVGSFFMRLAEDTARGIAPVLEKNLIDTINYNLKNYPIIDIDSARNPKMTIIIDASCPLSQLYSCLAALHRAKVGLIANVIVLDSGIFEEVALISSIVRNIGYTRTVLDFATEWMEAERRDRSDILVMLSGRAIVHEACLSNLADSFAADAAAGAVGGSVVDESGNALHGGLCFIDEKLVDCAIIHPDADINLNSLHAVHALAHHAVAFKRQAFRAVGGLDITFGDDLGAAIIDLCLRLRSHGWSIMTQPSATLSLLPSMTAEPWVTRSLAEPSRFGELIRSRWFSDDVVRSQPQGKRAVVIGDGLETNDELLVIRLLRDAQYTTTYIGPPGMALDRIDSLRRAGAFVIIEDDTSSALARFRVDIIYALGDIMVLEQSSYGNRVAVSLGQLQSLLSKPSEDGLVI